MRFRFGDGNILWACRLFTLFSAVLGNREKEETIVKLMIFFYCLQYVSFFRREVCHFSVRYGILHFTMAIRWFVLSLSSCWHTTCEMYLHWYHERMIAPGHSADSIVKVNKQELNFQNDEQFFSFSLSLQCISCQVMINSHLISAQVVRSGSHP